MATSQQRNQVRNSLMGKESENIAGAKRKATLMDQNRLAGTDLRDKLDNASVWANYRDAERRSHEKELTVFQERLRKCKKESSDKVQAVKTVVKAEIALQRRDSAIAIESLKKAQESAMEKADSQTSLQQRRSDIFARLDATKKRQEKPAVAVSEARTVQIDDGLGSSDTDDDCDVAKRTIRPISSSSRFEHPTASRRSGRRQRHSSSSLSREASPSTGDYRRSGSVHTSTDSGFHDLRASSTYSSSTTGSRQQLASSELSLSHDSASAVSFANLNEGHRMRDFGGSEPEMHSRTRSSNSFASSGGQLGSSISGSFSRSDKSSLVSMAEERSTHSSHSDLTRLPAVRGLIRRPDPIRRRSTKHLLGSVTP